MAINFDWLKDSPLDPFVDQLELLPGQSKAQRNADQVFREGQTAFDDLEVPDVIDPNYVAPEDVGGYDFSEVFYNPIQDSAFSDISLDPRLQNEQYESLAALDDIINGGGMSATGKASLNKALSSAAGEERGRREAILQGMQQRGMGGSGMELLSQLQSSQSATDRANQSGLDIAAMEEQNVLNAIMNSGQLAGNMQNAEFGRQSQIAQAKDALNQFNANNTLNTNMYNSGGTTQAAKDRVAQRQGIANQTAANQNLGRDSIINQTQGQFNNQRGLAQDKYGLSRDAQSKYESDEDRRVKKKAGIAQGVLSAAKGIAGGGF